MAREARQGEPWRAGARRAQSGRGVTEGERLAARLAPVTLVVGKGGVGKTTVAASLALHFAAGKKRTLVVTTDPSATLFAAFDRPIQRTTTPLADSNPSLWAFDTPAIRNELLEKWREPI